MRRILPTVTALAAALLLAGCGDTEKKPEEKAAEAAPKMPASPTIATIGKEDVKGYELANEMRLMGIPLDKDKRDDQATKRAMRELVQRRFLAQKAVAQKLDKDPSFLIEEQRAREQLLANFYLQRSVSDKWLNESQIYRFQLDHPLVFEKRQLIGIDQIAVPLAGREKAVIDATKNAKSLDDVIRALTALGATYSRGESELTTADIPAELFNAIEKKKADDVFFIARGGTGVFFVAKRIEPRPFTGEAATQLAKRLLMNEMLKEKAMEKPAEGDVHYEGDLDRIMKLPDAPPPPAAPAVTPAESALAPQASEPKPASPAAPKSKAEPAKSKEPLRK
jgi:EpsD family peptidyl-prolyl cis-trans isomerase